MIQETKNFLEKVRKEEEVGVRSREDVEISEIRGRWRVVMVEVAADPYEDGSLICRRTVGHLSCFADNNNKNVISAR